MLPLSPMFGGEMRYFARLNPLRAYVDLRNYLRSRPLHEVIFFFLAIVMTTVVMLGFLHDYRAQEKAYHREITYFQSWKLDRSDGDIRAQMKLDEPKRQAERREIDRLNRERQAAAKRLDEKLSAWGL